MSIICRTVGASTSSGKSIIQMSACPNSGFSWEKLTSTEQVNFPRRRSLERSYVIDNRYDHILEIIPRLQTNCNGLEEFWTGRDDGRIIGGVSGVLFDKPVDLGGGEVWTEFKYVIRVFWGVLQVKSLRSVLCGLRWGKMQTIFIIRPILVACCIWLRRRSSSVIPWDLHHPKNYN